MSLTANQAAYRDAINSYLNSVAALKSSLANSLATLPAESSAGPSRIVIQNLKTALEPFQAELQDVSDFWTEATSLS